MRFKLSILTLVASILPFLLVKQAAAAPALDVLPRSPIACNVKCQALISAFGYKLVDNAIIVARSPEDPECPKPHCTGYGKHKSCCGEAPVARSAEEPVCPKPHCTGYGKHKACGCGQAPSKEFLNALDGILGPRQACHNLVCEDPSRPWTCQCRDPPTVDVTARGQATSENDLASHSGNVARDDEDCEHWVCGDPADPSTCICQGLSAVEVTTRDMSTTPKVIAHLVARGNEDCDDWYCPDPSDPSSCFCRDHGAIEVTTRDTPPTADVLAHIEARYEPCQNWVCDDPSDPATCYCKDHGTALDIDLARRLAPCNEWHCDDPSDPYSCYCNDHSAAIDTKRAVPATPEDVAQFTTRAKDADLDDHDAAVLRRCHQQICSNPSDPTTCTCLDPPLPPVEPPPPGGGSLAATATRDMNPTADALAELQGRATQGMSLFRRGCNLICPDPADRSSCYCGDGPQERDGKGEGYHGNAARSECREWSCKDPNIPSSCYCTSHGAAARDEEVERSEKRTMYNDLAAVARKECTQWICKDPNIPSSCYCKNPHAAPTVEKAQERAVGLPHCHLVCTGYLQERKCSTCCGSLCGPARAVSDVEEFDNIQRAAIVYPRECRTHCSPIGLCKTLCTRPPTVAVMAREIEATTNTERDDSVNERHWPNKSCHKKCHGTVCHTKCEDESITEAVTTRQPAATIEEAQCRLVCDYKKGYPDCHTECPKPPTQDTVTRGALEAADINEERDVSIDAGHSQPANPHQKGCHTKCDKHGHNCHTTCSKPPADGADKEKRDVAAATTTSSLEERTCRQICAGYMQFKHCYPCCANCPPAMEAAGFKLVEDGEVTRLTLDGKVL